MQLRLVADMVCRGEGVRRVSVPSHAVQRQDVPLPEDFPVSLNLQLS